MWHSYCITSRISNITIKFSRIFCNICLNFLNEFKNVIKRWDKAWRAQQYWCTLHLKSHDGFILKNSIINKFYFTFPIHFWFDFNFTFSFWQSNIYLADGFNSKVAQFDEIFHLIYIMGVVQGVSSTLLSAIHVKLV